MGATKMKTGSPLSILGLCIFCASPSLAQDLVSQPIVYPYPTPAVTVKMEPEEKSTPRKKPLERRLLDLNKDGRLTIRDAFRLAGMRGKMEQVATIDRYGAIGIRNPVKLAGDLMLDLADDGKIAPSDPFRLFGVQVASFSNAGKLRYRGGEWTFQRSWRY